MISTDVYILDEVDPMEVFRFCQGLLTKYDEPRHLPPEQQITRHGQDTSYTGTPGVFEVCEGNPWSLSNTPEQDLPAWLTSAYRPGAALQADDPGHDEDCTENCTGNYHPRICWMSVNFDTTYSYRDKRGWGCSDLHAALVAELGAWLTGRDVRWEWRNEFTGEIHAGPEGLADLGAEGFKAQQWFTNLALPAIVSEVAGGGGGALNVGGHVIDVPDLSGGAS